MGEREQGLPARTQTSPPGAELPAGLTEPGTPDQVQRGLTGPETREDALRLDPVPLPAPSEYGFSLRYRGHRGIGVRLRNRQLRIGVPDSAESPIHVVLPDRAVTVAPGETCTLLLPEG